MDRSVNRLHGWLVALGIAAAGAMGFAPVQAQELCGGMAYPFPYTDVASIGAAFCPGIMEAYVTGVSKGTTPTTFSPNETVTRVQMTTFLQRSLDQGLARRTRRAALNQWWTPQNVNAMQTIATGSETIFCAADGEDIWATTDIGNAVLQVQASTGKILGTWTGANTSWGVLQAAGKVFAAGNSTPGQLYMIDPTQPPGSVTTAATGLGGQPISMTFDGTNIWTANFAGSVSIIPLAASTPYTVTNVSSGFTHPWGMVFDGTYVWVTDFGKLLKLSPTGAILQSVTVGVNPLFPAFDGTNIWVPNNNDNSISVVQASTGNVVATIVADANNQLNGPLAASFNGQRVLVANQTNLTVSVFKAADLSFIANVAIGAEPFAVCSDGINFWVTFEGGNLLRF